MLTGLLALTTAALFTGAALYINLVEQPARMILDDRAVLTAWKPAYKRGFAIQAPLAVVGFLLGVAAWWTSDRPAFLGGGLLMLANWPWTVVAILPTNRILMATAPEVADSTSRALLERWTLLHAVRSALGALATACFVWALS
ncbi:anthrone oxygenase family protein [Methylobacterium mesophilicum]|uniref:DUF1772 domain-containing protein n=1 Tax=Methylobacterium mesophilicum TaxID=39956 RepID=UPI0002C60CDD